MKKNSLVLKTQYLGGLIMNEKEMCLSLAKAENEGEVVKILKRSGHWDNSDSWQYYGGMENNFATIGNQQSSADSALVEKIVNSVDAVLMRECLKRGINPEGEDAPQSIEEALEEYFDIDGANLANVVSEKRRRLADNIRIVATGEKKDPSYSIIDKGEGQTPNKLADTLLSLVKSNKLKIPFVQGKFNMGGTGSLLFCGKNHLQLIISRRCPEVVRNEGDDGSSDLWGFTIVRREEPSENAKSSTYTYLAPKGEILSFKADSLPLIPAKFPEAYGKPLGWGTFIKLYNYRLQPSSLKTLINFNLYYRLSLLLPKIALPVLLEERRPYGGKTMNSTLSGLSVRLEEDKRNNIEDGFPSSEIINIDGQEMKVHIYAFKKEATVDTYKKKEGVIFTINGQSHGYINKSFFKRNSVKMDYISDYIFVIVDCSNISGGTREELFMNSRDRLRDGALKRTIEKELERIIKEHSGLRLLKQKRREESIKNKVEDSKPLAEILENVIKKSPTLSNLLILGQRITDPFNFTNTGTVPEFEGKEYPTYFKLKKEFSPERPKHCPINQRFRIQFETDAVNDYFVRDTFPGEIKLFYKGNEYNHRNISLWNGTANLNCEIPDDLDDGDISEFQVSVTDRTQLDPFESEFYILIDKPQQKNQGNGNRAQAAGGKGKDRKKPSGLMLPNIVPVTKDDWDEYGFDRETALMVKDSGEDGYDFYVNMDNLYLNNEIKNRPKTDPTILKSQYEYGMVLLSLSLLNSPEKDEDDEISIKDRIGDITKAIAPMLLPMIISLGELENV